MGDHFTTPAGQFRRAISKRLPRSIRVQRSRCRAGFSASTSSAGERDWRPRTEFMTRMATVADTVTHGSRGNNGSRGLFGGGNQGHSEEVFPQRVYITGMLIALGGIVMFFTALISAWVVRRGFPNTDWRPIALPGIVWLNTLILIASSATLALAERCLITRRDSDHRHWWHVTAILGALFLTGQVLAWRQMFTVGLFLATSPSSSFFYV